LEVDVPKTCVHKIPTNGSTLGVCVCCPMESYTNAPAQAADPNYQTHVNYKLLPIDRCGLSYHSTDSKIIGGNIANPGDFPWMTRIGLTGPSDREYPLKIIQLAEINENREYECIRDFIGSSRPNKGIVAFSMPEDYEPEELIIQPGYEYRSGSVDDIALIRLNRDINITNCKS
ncbi:unnamed protein product, partial [Allacma fusca]